MKNELQFFPHPEGYVSVVKFGPETLVINYAYQYKDHFEGGALKNSPVDYFSERARWRGGHRLNYGKDPETNVLKVLEENHYYPFGLKHQNYNTGRKQYGKKEDEITTLQFPGLVLPTEEKPMVYKYKYNGQEWQDELGLNWYTYRYRNYDPSFGRFMGIDPVSEEYFSISTFQFAHNNPVWKIEIEGLEGEPSNGKPDIKNHEPVKVKNNTTNAYVGGGLVEVKVVQESTKEVAKKTVLGNFVKGIGSSALVVIGALLTDTMSPNYGGRTSEIQPEPIIKIDELLAVKDHKIEEKTIEETGIKRVDSKSSADAEKLKLDLAFSEKASLFNKDGTLKQEVINNSKSIIPGNDLKNPSLVNELTKNGSNLDDWSKMSYSTGSGKNRIEVHYYYNNKTGETNYSLDYKTKLIGQ